MCGKFTQLASWREVHAFSQPLVARAADDPVVVATPMRMANVLRLDSSGRRELVAMRWGFSGRDDTHPHRPRHMHARSESIESRRTFAHAFAHCRGILLVDTFNEGEELPNGRTKQWVITPNDRQPIAIAVIYEEWRNGPETLVAFVMVTTPPNALIGRITDRMPAILPRDNWPAWLGEREASPAELKSLLRTYEDGGNWAMAEQALSPLGRRPRSPRSDKSQYDLF